MVRRLIQSFGPGRVPLMMRPGYARELVTSMTLPVAVSLVEGGVVGVLAKKVFAVGDWQLATIAAAPMFANLTSFLWARAARGRRKVRFITALMIAIMITVATIGLLPANRFGAAALTALVVFARCLTTGIVTLRSTVWRHNYPRHLRGQLTGRLAMVTGSMLFLVPLLGALLMDAADHSFRYYYPLAAMTAIIGAISFAKVRLRGERALLAYERSPHARPQRRGEAAPLYEYDNRARPHASTRFWAVLRDDPLFRSYMLWQFLGGVSNMMVEPVLIKVATDRTEGVAGGFMISIMLTQGLPMILMIATVTAWAAYLDKVHVAKFRVNQAWWWTASQVLMWAGAAWSGSLVGALILLGAGRLILGVARGGGVLAWNLGHNDFASREMVAVYMGIHVTLTGVRGALAPFIGMGLYSGWNPFTIPGLNLHVPGFNGIGAPVFLVAAALSVVSTVGFYTLYRRMTAAGHHGKAADG